MIANLSDRQFIIVDETLNLRKGFNGLFHYISGNFGTELFFNNVGYVFINRRRNMMKCLYWENESLAIWHKRLNKGTFSQSFSSQKCPLSFSELLLFLHGFVPPENRPN